MDLPTLSTDNSSELFPLRGIFSNLNQEVVQPTLKNFEDDLNFSRTTSKTACSTRFRQFYPYFNAGSSATDSLITLNVPHTFDYAA